MLDSNNILRCCIPSNKDYVSIEGHTILIDDISYINISLPRSALIAIYVPLTIQQYLSIFNYKTAIELSPMECELKGKLHINEDTIDCKIKRIVYNKNEHKYLFFIKFNPLDLKICTNAIINEKAKKLNESDLGEIIDLE